MLAVVRTFDRLSVAKETAIKQTVKGLDGL